MKKTLFTLITLAICCIHNIHADKIDNIMARVSQRHETGVNLTTLQSNVTTYLGKLQSDGSFSDVTYTNEASTNWNPIVHLERVSAFVLAYTLSGNTYYQSSDLYNKIQLSLELWYAKHPTSSNWWNNQIAVPKSLGLSLIQMRKGKTKLPSLLETNLINRMAADAGNPATEEGANKTDIATDYFYRACLKKDETALNVAISHAFQPLKIATGTEEGIRYDNSYMQHGMQLYVGGYSEELIKGITDFALNLTGTEYELKGEKLEILSNYIRNTYLKTIRGQYIHYNAMGRSVSRKGATMKKSFSKYITDMATIDPAHAAEYELAVKRMSGTENVSSGVKTENIVYPIADYVLHNRQNYSFGVRTISDRTAYIEKGNNENLKGYFMTFGSSVLTCSGNEYYNIYPVWDWSRIPGTTTMQLATIPKRKDWGVNGTSKFVGGVSDSLYAVTTYKHEDTTNGSTTRALKSWFMFDDEIVCLGSGIESNYNGGIVNTTVEQSLKSGNITVFSNNSETALSLGSHNFTNNINWIHHNNIAYFFPKGGKIVVDNKQQSGKWYDINTTQDQVETINSNVFTTYFDHGTTPLNATYAYIIVPNKKTTAEVKAHKISDIEILENTEKRQVVHHKRLGILQLVFFEAGTFTDGKISIEVDKPCAIMLKDLNSSEVTMHIADPAQRQSIISVKSLLPTVSDKLVETICCFSGVGSDLAGFTKKYTIVGKDAEKDVLYTREASVSGDTYVRDGASYENTNSGGEDGIYIKMDGTGFNREGFIKMLLREMDNLNNPAGETVGKVELSLTVTYTNTSTNEIYWILNPVEDTTWDEMKITYATKPTHSEKIAGLARGVLKGSVADNKVYFDITDYAKEQYAKGKTDIAFRIYNDTKTSSAKHDVKFGSKENTTESNRPKVIFSVVEKVVDSSFELTSLQINGEAHDPNEIYLVPCATNTKELTIDLDIADGVYMNVDKQLKVDVNTPSEQRIKIELGTSADDIRNEYILVIKKMFDFNDIVIQKFNKRLIINSNPELNGGYTFKKYYWKVDNVEQEGGIMYSAGGDKQLSPTSVYSARLITSDDKELSVCPTQIKLTPSSKVSVYPIPVRIKQTINIDIDPSKGTNYKNTKVRIYTLGGSMVSETTLTESNAQIDAPNVAGIYVLQVIDGETKKEFKLKVN